LEVKLNQLVYFQINHKIVQDCLLKIIQFQIRILLLIGQLLIKVLHLGELQISVHKINNHHSYQDLIKDKILVVINQTNYYNRLNKLE